MMIFVVNNLDNFHANSSLHCLIMRHKNHLHITLLKFSSIQKAVTTPQRYFVVYLQVYLFINCNSNCNLFCLPYTSLQTWNQSKYMSKYSTNYSI